MRNKVLFKILATVLLSASLGVARADTVSWDFFGTAADGPYAGQTASGAFTYDLNDTTGVGAELLRPDQTSSLTLRFTFLGTDYFALHDIDFPTFPQINLLDGLPVRIDYIIDRFDAVNPTPITEPDILSFFMQGALIMTADGRFEAPLTVNTVPLPAGWWFLSSALGGLALLRRRHAHA